MKSEAQLGFSQSGRPWRRRVCAPLSDLCHGASFSLSLPGVWEPPSLALLYQAASAGRFPQGPETQEGQLPHLGAGGGGCQTEMPDAGNEAGGRRRPCPPPAPPPRFSPLHPTHLLLAAFKLLFFLIAARKKQLGPKAPQFCKLSSHIIRSFGLGCHQYADDTQLYLLMDGHTDLALNTLTLWKLWLDGFMGAD
uniref:uncharacterized protein LOC114587471 isoform X3 n=1 Tax=Podarcis muralis TaxID=64176 RepID=UPI00109FE3F3|nr:uncharacterized protein LOC114587471 isoform X3 [Podarcis muralis]